MDVLESKYLDLTLANDRIIVKWKENGKYLGFFYREVDGYYVYQPETEGCWSGYGLRAIADALDQLNKEWDEHIKKSSL